MVGYIVYREIGKMTIDELVCKFEEIYGVDLNSIASRSRRKHICVYRQLLCYLAIKYTHISKSGLGILINRDHSTVISSIKKVETWGKFGYTEEKKLLDKFRL